MEEFTGRTSVSLLRGERERARAIGRDGNRPEIVVPHIYAHT